MNNERYWIAINGSSCAMLPLPLKSPVVEPTPEQLLGFLTLEQARRAQEICLHAEMREVRKFLEKLRPAVVSGKIRVIMPPHPKPQTAGPTMWFSLNDGDELVRVH